jgi:hypothetical protein
LKFKKDKYLPVCPGRIPTPHSAVESRSAAGRKAVGAAMLLSHTAVLILPYFHPTHPLNEHAQEKGENRSYGFRNNNKKLQIYMVK